MIKIIIIFLHTHARAHTHTHISLRFILESFPWIGILLNQGIGPQCYWTFVYPIEDPQAIFNELNIKSVPGSLLKKRVRTSRKLELFSESFKNYFRTIRIISVITGTLWQNYFKNHRTIKITLERLENYPRTMEKLLQELHE